MKIVSMVLILGFAAAVNRATPENNGAYGSREWLADCATPNPSIANTRCYQFMRGVVEGVIVAETSHPDNLELTEDLSYSRIIMLAREFARGHLEAYDEPAADLIAVAIQEACPAK